MYKLSVDILPHIYSSVSICTINTIQQKATWVKSLFNMEDYRLKYWEKKSRGGRGGRYEGG